MAVKTKSALIQRLVQLIRSGMKDTSAKNLREMFVDVIDTLFSLTASGNDTDVNLSWDAAAVYDTANNPFAVYQLRLFKTKADNNTGHQPPGLANVDGNYEDAYWVEVSPAPASGIAAWQAGTYTGSLVIIYKDGKLYRLADAARPFTSSNFATELTAEKWVAISGSDNPEPGEPTATGPSQLMFSVFSDLDTSGAEVTLEGKIIVDKVLKSARITGYSFMVKLDTASAYTPQASISALNAWISAQVGTSTIWQFYPLAEFGSEGAGSLTINYHV